MLRRLGRFVQYQLSPDSGSRAVRPASITYCHTASPEAVAGSVLVIDCERVARALARLDPLDREILEFSMRPGVADGRLAFLRKSVVPEFARRRAGALERLLSDLGVERDEDLGVVLDALIDLRTWAGLDVVGVSAADNPERGGASGRLLRAPQPVTLGREETVTGADAIGRPTAGMNRLPKRGARIAQPGPPLELRPLQGTVVALSQQEERRSRARPARGHLAAWLVAAAVLATSGLVGPTAFGGREHGFSPTGDRSPKAGPFLARRLTPVGAPFPSDPRGASRYPTAHIRRSTLLYDRPAGRPEVRIAGRTEWGSARVLSVVRQHGTWLGVLAPELENEKLGWLEADRAQIDTVGHALHADLSRRELTIRHDGRIVGRMRVAIGAPSTPTPTGRFAVTDKLDVTDRSSPYGCCVLVLTAHQRKLPPDWPGGDRLAVHSTRDVKALGHPVSLGCIRASFPDARSLMRTIPLGAPVFVRP